MKKPVGELKQGDIIFMDGRYRKVTNIELCKDPLFGTEDGVRITMIALRPEETTEFFYADCEIDVDEPNESTELEQRT